MTDTHAIAPRGKSNSNPKTGNPLVWWLLSAIIILTTIVGFFFHGGRLGLYSDDYSKKAWAYNFASSKWKLNLYPMFGAVRPVAYIMIANFGNAIPSHELPVRIGLVAIHVLNVVLLGWLAFRLSSSLLVGLFSGTFFLMPIFAHDAVLWFTAAVHNVIALLLLLVGFHLLLHVHSVRNDLGLFVGGILAWSATILFYESGFFVPLLLPLMAMTLDEHEQKKKYEICGLALASTYIWQCSYFVFLERTASLVSVRGGLKLDPAFIISHRIPAVVRRTIWLATDFGVSGPFKEALRLALHGLRSTFEMPILFAAILALLLLAVIYPANQEKSPSGRLALALVGIGVGWTSLGLALLVFFKDQTAETRVLYTPLAGVALAGAAFLAWLPSLFGRWRGIAIRISLLVAGATLLVSTLIMAGLVRTYQLRWDLDQKQLAAFQKAISVLPDSNPLWLLPVSLDERTVSTILGRPAQLDRWLAGAFELPWSASDAVRMAYGDRDIRSVTSTRWDHLHLTAVQRSRDGQIQALVIQGSTVPVSQVLAFTYHNGRLIMLNPVKIMAEKDAVIDVDLPLTGEVAQAERVETEQIAFELER